MVCQDRVWHCALNCGQDRDQGLEVINDRFLESVLALQFPISPDQESTLDPSLAAHAPTLVTTRTLISVRLATISRSIVRAGILSTQVFRGPTGDWRTIGTIIGTIMESTTIITLGTTAAGMAIGAVVGMRHWHGVPLVGAWGARHRRGDIAPHTITLTTPYQLSLNRCRTIIRNQ